MRETIHMKMPPAARFRSGLLGVLLTLLAAPALADGFTPLFPVRNGEGLNELAWAVKEGKLLTGYLLGPNAFLTLPEGDHVALDTRNARLVLRDPTGAVRRSLDLAQAAAKAGLPRRPVAVDVAVDPGWRYHVADEGNFRVLVLDGDGNLLRTAGAAGTGEGELVQLNRVHATGAGETWVEDHARQRTVVFGPDGRFLRAHEGFTNLAVDRYGNFTLPVWTGDPASRELRRHDPSGTPVDLLGKIVAPAAIRHIRTIGQEADGSLHFVYDTDAGRTFCRFDASTGRLATRRLMQPNDAGVAIGTPEWVSPAGDLYRAMFTPTRLTIERWRRPFDK